MAKTKIQSGDIFQISLPNALGFAYAKYIDLLEINSAHQYPNLVRIYNHRSTVQIKSVEGLEKYGLLFAPLMVAGIPAAIKKGIWKLVGNIPVKSEEEIIPHYKLPEPSLPLEEEKAKEWFYVIDADKFTKKVKSTYANVKHLETLGATGSELLGTKIAMALLKDEGKKIEDYFQLKDFFEKVYYNDVVKIPAYYKQSEIMRGKALQS